MMQQLSVVSLIVAALALFSCCSCDVIDANEFNSASVGELCNNKEARIEHISTIGKLFDTFESSAEIACRDQWLEPLRDLKQVLDASAEDACSLHTANKIEDFQWLYIVGTLSKSWREASAGSIPEPLRLFFMHFVDETVNRCKSEASQRLEQAIGGSTETEVSSLSQSSLGPLIDALSIALVPQSNIKKFDDFFFIFNSIFMLERRKGNLGEGLNTQVTGEVTYASVKMHDATRTNEVKTKCGQELRPVYSNTILPLMKLIDLGYGSKGAQMNNKVMANWYGIVQLCELIMPIKFYSSEALKKDQYAIVEREEAKVLEAQSGPAPEYPQNIQVQATKLSDSVSNASDDHIARSVRSSFKSRARIYRKTLKHTFGKARSIIGSKVKSIFFHRRSKGNTDNNLASSLDEGHKMLLKDELEDSTEEDHSVGHLTRHKRGFEDTGITTTTPAPVSCPVPCPDPCPAPCRAPEKKDNRNIIERLLEKKRVRYCIIALLILLMAGLIAVMLLGSLGFIGG